MHELVEVVDRRFVFEIDMQLLSLHVSILSFSLNTLGVHFQLCRLISILKCHLLTLVIIIDFFFIDSEFEIELS